MAQGIAETWAGIRWGESSAELARHFGARATVLPRPVDFGDSYADVVLRDQNIGGFALTVFFQMDKASGGLKRVQIERRRHGVTPPALRAVLAALEEAYGPPDLLCGTPARAASGYQAAAERLWRRDGGVIRAVFRDNTIDALDVCLGGPGIACSLGGQLLIRITPADTDALRCR